MSFIGKYIMNTANLVINDILKIMKIGEKMEKLQKPKKVTNLMSSINPDKIRVSEFSERQYITIKGGE